MTTERKDLNHGDQSEARAIRSREIIHGLFELREPPEAVTPNEVRLRAVLANIATSPELLMAMPDGYCRAFDFMTDEEAETSAGWLRAIGLDEDLLLERLSQGEIERCAQFTPRVAEILRGEDVNSNNPLVMMFGPPTNFSFLDVLQILQRTFQEQLFVEGVLEEGRRVINRYLPIALPIESTELIFMHGDTVAHYLGKIIGRHYLVISTATEMGNCRPFDHLPVEERAALFYQAGHELIHQKQAEVLGQEIVFVRNPDFLVFPPDLEMSPTYIHELVVEGRCGYVGKVKPQSPLIREILEGIAVLGTQYISYRYYQDLQEVDTERARAVRSVMRKGFRIIRENLDTQHAKGVQLVRILYDIYGMDRIFEVLFSIDFEACRTISDDEYRKIHENPLLIPGLNR